MFTYRLHSPDGDDLDEATYPGRVKIGEQLFFGGGRRFRVLDVVMFDDKVGWRKREYERTRPKSGERISDVEWSLSHIEDKAPAILRSIRELWPLEAEKKAVLAELIGYQVVRGPRWTEWHNRYVETQVAEYKQLLDLTGEESEALTQHLQSDTTRLVKMLDLGVRLASIAGCMHWSLLEFEEPNLATSDHPVDVWPVNASSRKPEVSTSDGMLNAFEIRFPIIPTTALLMSWVDDHDAASTLDCARHHAAHLNAFTIANTDREWFHLPDTNPPVAKDHRFLPLSAELIPDYGAHQVHASLRRTEVTNWLESTKGQTLEVRDKLVIT
jgi:hypothetical protein